LTSTLDGGEWFIHNLWFISI